MKHYQALDSFTDIKVLSDPRRMAVVRLLMRAPATLSQLGEQLGMSAARVRHHLKLLEAAGLVELDHTLPAGGFTEKYYRASAQAYFIQRVILPHPAQDGTIFIIGSHDPALELLADGLSTGLHHPELRAIPVGSLDGLVALRQSLCQITGCHLFEPESGTYNASYVRHFFPGQPMEIFTLAYRQQGLLIRAGNPRQIAGLGDLAREDITFINRRPGSGTRLWLDWQILEQGLDSSVINGWLREVNTHAAVAQAVLSGEADYGLAVAAAARSSGLDFIPLFEERFDLVLTKPTLEDPLIGQLLDSICSAPIRRRISSLAGYRTTDTGAHVQVI
jgi:putative molybdopterin biosynthesis protein